MLDQSELQSNPFSAPGEDAVEACMVKTVRATRKHRRAMLLSICLFATAFIPVSLLMSLPLDHSQPVVQICLLTLVAFYVCFALAIDQIVVTRSDRSAIKALAKCSDVRAIGPLLDTLTLDRRQAEMALCLLLPRLQVSDALAFNARQRQMLYRLLDGNNIPLALAIVRALEQIGDANALPFVKKLAAGQGRARQNKTLQDAAQNCLLFLQQKERASRVSDQLLRAASPTTSPDLLLRPAVDTNTSGATQLLRAVEGD